MPAGVNKHVTVITEQWDVNADDRQPHVTAVGTGVLCKTLVANGTADDH